MYNNFEISLAVFTPNITTNHAITCTNLLLWAIFHILHSAWLCYSASHATCHSTNSFLFLPSPVEIYRFVMNIFTHILYNGWDKNRKRKVPCTNSVRFTQLWSNILSFENIFFLNHRKRFHQKLEFSAISLSLFTYSSFY